ncbi:MAG: DUF2625 family protein [Ruminococcus sp.]|nr:DUF2625 family protein [Ruminococcus sp.]
MENKNTSLWNQIKTMFENSDRDIAVLGTYDSNEEKTVELLGISPESVLANIILNTSGVVVDNWVRIFGHTSSKTKGITGVNAVDNSGIPQRIPGMLIVGSDIVGGIFAINLGKFSDNVGTVWYFAPDSLDWECLEFRYAEFIAWTAQDNMDRFYMSMRWQGWRNIAKEVSFNDGILIYPFLWSRESDIENDKKSVVPFEEIFKINMDFKKKFMAE